MARLAVRNHGENMNLVEEIESAAINYNTFENGASDYEIAYELVDSPWWPRIKAALEVAQEMVSAINNDVEYPGPPHDGTGKECPICQSYRKFREAMGNE